jgi:DNA-binding XRE family transcriptional regulator
MSNNAGDEPVSGSSVAAPPVTVGNPDNLRSPLVPRKRGAKGFRARAVATADDVRNPDDPGSMNSIDLYSRELELTIARNVYKQRKWRYPFHTQEDVAQVLNVSRATVVAIEKGARKLTAVELVLLAEWWQIPVTELLP